MTAPSISTLAHRCDTKIETIRYYEQIGMMPPPAHTNGGQRVCDEAHLKQLIISAAPASSGSPSGTFRSCSRCRPLTKLLAKVASGIAVGHLGDLRQKTSNLQALEATRKNLLKTCAKRVGPACPLIETLYKNPNSLVTSLGRK
jgi:MerR family mercuric resistance operon transcriptional regulator